MIDPMEAARIVERVMTEWGKQDSLRDMLDEITAALLAGEPVFADTASDIDRARREGWARGMADTLKTIQSVGKIHVSIKCELCPHDDGCMQCESDGECVVIHRAVPSSPSPAVRDGLAADDAEVMRIWRKCGLPEYFLGNGGSNHKLVVFAKACAAVRDVTLREALERLNKALLSDAPSGPQKTIAGDDTIYHLDGQKMYHAINAVREAIAALSHPSLPDGEGNQ